MKRGSLNCQCSVASQCRLVPNRRRRPQLGGGSAEGFALVLERFLDIFRVDADLLEAPLYDCCVVALRGSGAALSHAQCR